MLEPRQDQSQKRSHRDEQMQRYVARVVQIGTQEREAMRQKHGEQQDIKQDQTRNQRRKR